jgi:sugar diacid utilization regulator
MTDTCTSRAIAAFTKVASGLDEVEKIDDLLVEVARQISKLVGVERCSVFLRDEREDLFRGCVSRSKGGAKDDDIRHCLAGIPADRVTREVMRTRQPVIVANARSDTRMVKATVRRWKVRSVMSVPMISGAETIGLMMLDDTDRQHSFTEEDAELARCFAELAAVAVAQTQLRLELSSKLAVAGRQVQSLRRATAVDEKLTELVLDGKPLDDLLGTLAELLLKPCAIFDEAGARIATALPGGADESGVPRLLEPAFASNPEIRRALAEHDGSRVFVVGPLPRANLLRRHVVAPVMLGEEVWGRLVVMEHKSRFNGGDMIAVRRAAALIALQVSADRSAVEADWNAGSSLAAELLGGCSDAETVQRRAERLGIALDAPRVVMLAAARSGNEDEAPDFRTVAAAFGEVAPRLRVQVTAVNGAVAALVELPADGGAADSAGDYREVFEAVREQLEPGLIAGISSVYSTRDGYRSAHREARQVVECIRRFSPVDGPALFTADDLGIGALLLSSSDSDAVSSFAEETVGELVREHSKADLLTTLCSFFENMGSIRGSAAALDVHENTIRYRLSRVEELTGLAIMHDPDAQLRARLSLLVLMLKGRLPSGLASPAPAESPLGLAVVDAAA